LAFVEVFAEARGYSELRSWRHLIGLSIGRSMLPAPWAAS
jgi:hypothetical protein